MNTSINDDLLNPDIDIITDTDLNFIWQQVFDAIPSKHLTPDHRDTVRGSRRALGYYTISHINNRRSLPLLYLEIGTRRGHSLAMVMLCGAGMVDATSVDMWIENYGNEPNSLGAVMTSMRGLGIPKRTVEYIVGDSHTILPTLIEQKRKYDLIMVDGDHTVDGARRDLLDSIELLAPRGVIVFDDAVPELADVVYATCEQVGGLWCGWYEDEWSTPWMVVVRDFKGVT